MTPTRSITASMAIAVLAVTMLSACDPGAATNSGSATPSAASTAAATPSATPSPTLVGIETVGVDADSVYVLAIGGAVIVDIPFSTDPAQATTMLNDAIGLDATTVITPASYCYGGLTKSTWGGITFYSPYASAPPGAQFWAVVDGYTTSNSIVISMPTGASVGFDATNTMAGFPAGELLDFGMEGEGTLVFAYDIASGDPSGYDDFYGGMAVFQDGALERFSSPIHYWYDC